VASLTYNDKLFSEFIKRNNINININTIKQAYISIGKPFDNSNITISAKNIHITDGTGAEYYEYGGMIKADSSEHLIIINEAAAIELFGQIEYDDIIVDASVNFDDISTEIFKVVGGFSGIVIKPFQLEIAPDTLQLIVFVIIILALTLFIFITLITIEINNTKAIILSRKKEYGTFLAIGASSKILRRIVGGESLIIGLEALIISIMISALGDLLLSLMIFQEIKINVISLFIMPILNIVIYHIICYQYLDKLSEFNISELLKQSE
jgi:ABC-type antimicrobial peptide transport system permease subunit